jgi:hypothetical protein
MIVLKHMYWLPMLSVALCLVIGGQSVRGDDRAEFVRLMNQGRALLENHDSAKALPVLKAAVQLRRKSLPALRNYARAQIMAEQPAEAVQTLRRALEIDPQAVATIYLTAIAWKRQSDFKQAAQLFEQAARLDPETAAIRFQLAIVYQADEQTAKAIEQFNETIRLDPQHAGAYYQLANLARKARDIPKFRRLHATFLKLKKLQGDVQQTPAAMEACRYTLPEPPGRADGLALPHAPPARIKVRFTDVTDAAFGPDVDRRAATIALLEVDEHGCYTFFCAKADGTLSLITWLPGGKIKRKALDLQLKIAGGAIVCVVGDFHDDVPEGVRFDPKIHALADVLLIGEQGAHLLKQTARGTFADVTANAKLETLRGKAARWFDYDHDGDLDLLVAGSTGVSLWQNNGDATFKDVTGDVGIPKFGACVDLAAADLNANIAIDFVVARGVEPTQVFENQRAGRFAPMPEPPGPWPAARKLWVNDVNNDGHLDAVLAGAQRVTILLEHAAKRQQIDLAGFNLTTGVLFDYDNDGWLDLAAIGSNDGEPQIGVIRIWRGCCGDTWPEVTNDLGLKDVRTAAGRQMLAADFDADGDTDLILVTADNKLRLLRNEGGHVNGQLKIRLVTQKTNPCGLGTRVELRAGEHWVSRAVEQLPIELGLDGHKRVDSVRTVWTNGAIDNQIAIEVGDEPLTIVEQNVATGSCPFLYVWDGTRFRFINDLLGDAPVGLSIARDVILPADPDELVLIGRSDVFQPLDGAYTFKISSEFPEVLYLDYVKLVAVDHNAELEVHPLDKFFAPTRPSSQLWPLGNPISIISAQGDDGIDRSQAVLAIDGNYAPPGPILPPPLRGLCEPMALTLDFGPIDTQRPLVLALTGWIQYGDASRNIAMSQNSSLQVFPPQLEAQMPSGEWLAVDVTVGMPAGKTKTILCDLAGKLPQGTQRLRLTTTFELRWDRIMLFERKPAEAISTHTLEPDSAAIAWRGFSELRSRAPNHPTTPDYDKIIAPPWHHALQGWSTRYGEIHELIAQIDGKMAIVNGGDVVTIRCNAAGLPPIPAGKVRTFFIYSYGWDKDGDHNVVDGDHVGTLPEMDERGDWQQRYNTRWVPPVLPKLTTTLP